jgi:hypothetical protein
MDFEKIRNRFIPMSETMLYILLSLRVERHGYCNTTLSCFLMPNEFTHYSGLD